MLNVKEASERHRLFKSFIIVAFCILFLRFFYLQIISSNYQIIAFDNAVYKKIVYPDRGIIFDRDDKPLLNNITTYYLIIIPNLFKKIDTPYFCSLLEIDIHVFKNKLNALIHKNSIYRPIIFQPIFSDRIVSKLQENMFKFNGVELEERKIRYYPSHLGANLLGYIGEVDTALLKKHFNYSLGDYIGLTGLEAYYENILRGSKGINYVVRDNKNRQMGAYENGAKDVQAVPGQNIKTSISLPIQALAEKLLKNKIGSIIACDPRDGSIITLASGPIYDPNLLTKENRNSNFLALRKDETSPLLNRCIKGTYSPGSTFKPIEALIGLQEKVISPDYSFNCHGSYVYCGKIFACTHATAGHASNLRKAVANSCNSYFIHLFRLIVDNDAHNGVAKGLSVWKKYLNNFGLGNRLGIDLPYEVSGYVPDSVRYNRIFTSRWNSCNIASLGIGQGELSLTPLQLLNLTNIIANKGYYYTPHIVSSIENANEEGKEILRKHREKKVVVNIPIDMYDNIINAMEDVVNTGTGKAAQIAGIKVCAKTGTVENQKNLNSVIVKLPNHSLFIAFAPKDTPRIAIAVAIENSGGYGATWAAPMASLIMERYLKNSLSPERLKQADKISEANLIPNYLIQKRKEREKNEKEKLDFVKDNLPASGD